ncbi:hypothetical protein [Enterococcus gallinarum]|nr:hypothetical protein [Enterococcus gallinarum]
MNFLFFFSIEKSTLFTSKQKKRHREKEQQQPQFLCSTDLNLVISNDFFASDTSHSFDKKVPNNSVIQNIQLENRKNT